jgi:hypothetical protein
LFRRQFAENRADEKSGFGMSGIAAAPGGTHHTDDARGDIRWSLVP